MPAPQKAWRVLLIGGPSGVGKTMVSRQLGLRTGTPWLQVDDLRLAFIHSRVTLPQRTETLTLFQGVEIWQQPPERFRDGLIAMGEVMTPAIEIVIANHVDTLAPLIIEGDAILPSLFARPIVQECAQAGHVQAVFLVEPEEDVLLANMLARGRGVSAQSEVELRTEVRAKWLYGRWLIEEARRYNLPILEPRPWATLVERITTVSDSPVQP